MNYKILATSNFDKDVKRLFKKHRSFKNDLKNLKELLLENPFSGTSVGSDCYKIRLAIKSKGRGKSGGARVITFVKVLNEEVHLLTVYDKSEKKNISDTEIKNLIQSIDN